MSRSTNPSDQSMFHVKGIGGGCIRSFFVAALILWSGAAFGDRPNPEAEHLIRGVQAARQQLKSGVVRAEGSRNVIRTEDSIDYTSDIGFLIAFDHEESLLRYDTFLVLPTILVDGGDLREGRINVASREEISESDSVFLRHCLNSLRTPEMFAFYSGVDDLADDGPRRRTEAGSNLDIVHGNAGWAGGHAGTRHVIDIRSAGLFNFWEYEGQGVMCGTNEPDVFYHLCDLDLMIEKLRSCPDNTVEHSGDLSVLRCNGRTVAIDVKSGHTAVQYRLETDTYTMDSSVRWSQHGGVWVPTDFMIERLDLPEEGDVLRHTYTLAWSHINEEVPGHYFEIDDFPDIGDGTHVVDQRVGKPTVIGEWMGGKFVRQPQLGVHEPGVRGNDARGDTDTSQRKWLLWVVNSVAVIIAGAVLWRRYRRTAG